MVAESPPAQTRHPHPTTQPHTESPADQARRWTDWAAEQCGLTPRDIRPGPRWQNLRGQTSRRAICSGKCGHRDQARAIHLRRCKVAWFMRSHPWPETHRTATLAVIVSGLKFDCRHSAHVAIKRWIIEIKRAIDE